MPGINGETFVLGNGRCRRKKHNHTKGKDLKPDDQFNETHQQEGDVTAVKEKKVQRG